MKYKTKREAFRAAKKLTYESLRECGTYVWSESEKQILVNNNSFEWENNPREEAFEDWCVTCSNRRNSSICLECTTPKPSNHKEAL